jgi:hypothetical protein
MIPSEALTHEKLKHDLRKTYTQMFVEDQVPISRRMYEQNYAATKMNTLLIHAFMPKKTCKWPAVHKKS